MCLCSVILVGGHAEQSFFTLPTPLRFLQREPQAWISSRGYLINSNSCIQYCLFFSCNGKRNPFFPPDHSISYISEDKQDCNTFVHFPSSRKTLLYKKAHQNEQNNLWSEEAHIKSLSCPLNQDKEPTLGCPTSIWDAVINTASLPSARCQFVELLLCLPSLFQMSSLFALSHACSHSFCVPSAF